MRAIWFRMIGFLLLTGCGFSWAGGTTSALHATSFIEQEIADGKIVRVEALTENSVKVSRRLTAAETRKSLVLLDQDTTQLRVSTSEDETLSMLEMSGLQVVLSKTTGLVSFYTADGKLLLAETSVDQKPVVVAGAEFFEVSTRWGVQPGASYYGLGQLQDGVIDYAGRVAELAQDNTVAVSPVVHSSAGYAIYWDQYSHSTFDAQQADSIAFSSEVSDGIEYVFIMGESFDERIATYRELTGTATLLPKWAFGYQQSRERYKTQDEVVDIVKEFRRRHFPLDLIIQDWKYWGDDFAYWSGMRFDPERYPEPSRLPKEVHAEHAKIMLVVWPFVGEKSQVCADLKEVGGLVGQPKNFPKKSFMYDPYSATARAVYWEHAKKTMIDNDFDAWWVDGAEPENFFSGPTELGPLELVRNAFSLVHSGGLYEGQRRVNNGKRVYSLVRSVFTGQQRYGAATWSGDIDATWDVLAKQIPAGLSYSAAGLPYWTTDIGAFTVKNYEGGCKNDAYRELYTRWFQFGAFCPLFRSHGTDTPREPWFYGEPGTMYYDTLLKFTQLRYRLLPYIYSMAGLTTQKAYTPMRAMPMDFADPSLAACTDQFMFGSAFMVAPILSAMEAGVAEREVIFPANTTWFDFWSGKQVKGAGTQNVSVPLDQLPLYVRAGSIVPMGPIMEYTDQLKGAPLELRIYPGSDGEYTLYQDEGDGYGYEKGDFSMIKLAWNDADQTLTVAERAGSYPGMPESIPFNVVLVEKGNGVGLDAAKTIDHTLIYTGKEAVVPFLNK